VKAQEVGLSFFLRTMVCGQYKDNVIMRRTHKEVMRMY